MDTGSATAVGATLLAWPLDDEASAPHLVGAIELTVTAADPSLITHVVRARQPVTAERPGNPAAASARLLQTLAAEVVTRAGVPPPGGP